MFEKNKKKPYVRFHHRFFNGIIRPLFGPIFRCSYHFHGKLNRIRKQGPFLILANHTVNLDPILLGTVFNFPIYYVASDQLMNQGFTSALLKYFFAPIGKTKSMPDIAVITTIKRIISQGGSVAIFVEGNVTLTGETVSIPPAIGKLIKLVNRPVIFYTNQGLSFNDPRWSVFRKHGYSTGSIKRMMQPEEFAPISAEDLNDLVKRELYVNAYDKDPKLEYRGKKIAVGLQRLVFVCPKCHQPFGMSTYEDKLHCSHCGFVGTYDTHGYLQSELGPKTLIELNRMTLNDWTHFLKHNPDTVLKDSAQVFFTYRNARKRTRKGKQTFSVTPLGVTVTRNDEIKSFTYDDILGFAMQQKNKIIVYLHDQLTLFVKFNNRISAYQYLVTLQLYQNRHLMQKGEIKDDYFSMDEPYQHLGL